MKKTIFISTVLAALACICASCQKGLEEVQEGGLTVTATIAGGGNGSADGTKVLAEDTGTALKLKWEVGDIVFGFDNATPTPNTYNFKVTAVAGGKATLKRIAAGSEKGTATSDPTNGTKMYLFYAPGMKASDLNLSGGDLFSYDISNQGKDVIPVLMTSTGTVQNGALALDFQVRTALIGIKTPTMASGGTEYSSIVLKSTGTLYNQVKFYLDGGDLKVTYEQASSGNPAETVTSITKKVDFTSDPTTQKGPDIYIVACPMAEADLTFSTSESVKFKKTGKSLEAGKYYYMTPTFEEERIITVSFSEATQDTFGSNAESFNFAGGEEILVSDGTTSRVHTISVDNDIVSFTTTLKGALTAIFPTTAANTGTNPISANSNDAISATQDGTLANAIVAKASIEANGSTAVFENQNNTAVFKIALPTPTDPDKNTVGTFTIKSLPAIGSDGYRTGSVTPITDSGNPITIIPGSGCTTCYVCIIPGVNLSDLAFDLTYESTADNTLSGSMKGIPERNISGFNQNTNIKDDTFATHNRVGEKTVYNLDDSNWHEYVKFGNTKWATMNIGAASVTDPGEYFAWGELNGHKPTGTTFDFSTFNHDDARYNNTFDTASGFASSNNKNTPYAKEGASSFSKYYNASPTSDSRTELQMIDDAAYYNWGGPWEMPTYDSSNDDSPFNYIRKKTNAYHNWKAIGSYPYSGAEGVLFKIDDSSKLQIFLPLSGYGSGLSVSDWESSTTKRCCYWSKNVCDIVNSTTTIEDSNKKAFCINFFSGTTGINYGTSTYGDLSIPNIQRFYGYCIRPVSAY